MTGDFMREERYIVFKMSDLGNSLKGDEIRKLAQEYAEQRRLKGKKPLECVVVEKDWPEYEPTWKAIEARATGTQPAPNAVAYLDIGAGGYMDIGTDLTDEALATLPKGRHMLGIVGTYGVEGYVPAQTAPSVPDLLESLRCACNYIDKLGGVSQQYRAMLASPEANPAPSVPEGWQLVPTAESRHPGIYKMLGSLHAADNTPGMSEWESYRAMLSEAPEAKP